jgi:hypothetical protein
MSVVHTAVGCLGIVLGLYGYESEDQQNHFINLLELSDTKIPNSYTSFMCEKNTQYDAQEWLIGITQEKFYARASGERWEQKIPEWISKNAPQIIIEGEQLGIVSKSFPSQTSFECVAIFGSTAPHMRLTIEDLKDRVEAEEISTQKVFLLTGERYAVAKVDGGEDYIQKISTKYHVVKDKVTEAMLMEDLYKNISSASSKLKNILFKTVDTPKGNKARPNTIDTIEAFLNGLQMNECKSVLFVSRAPYKIAQEEDVKKIMYKLSPQREFEVVGGAADIREVKSKNSAAYHMLMGIAGGLYGGFERVTMEINSKNQMCSSIEYLTNYKGNIISRTYAAGSEKNVELHDTKID